MCIIPLHVLTQMIGAPLQAYACCTRSLLMWCLVGSNGYLHNSTLNNNMGSRTAGELGNSEIFVDSKHGQTCAGNMSLSDAKYNVEFEAVLH